MTTTGTVALLQLQSSAAADRWNLRRSVCLRITKFSDNFDNGALAALRGHTRRREKIDSLLLVQRANHDLKLWIGETHRLHRKFPARRRALPKTGQQKRVERVGADREIAAPVSGRDRILSNGNSVSIERKIRRIDRARRYSLFHLHRKLSRSC